MSTFTKVLAALNLVAVIALILLAASSLKARLNYAQVMDKLMAARDGGKTDDLLTGLSAEQRQQITTALKSDYAQRRAAGDAQFQATKDQPIAVISPEAQKILDKMGPEEYKLLVQKYIKIEEPKLTDEERALEHEKILLLTLKARYQVQQAQLTAEIERREAERKQEEDIQKRVRALNVERQRELARLRTELEEAVAARNLAQGNLHNTQEYLKQTIGEAKMLAGQNQTLAGEIKKQELPEGR